MKYLQLKCPPPIVMLISAIIASIISQRGLGFIQQQVLNVENIIWPLIFVLAGFAVALAGVKEFSAHQTTVNPLDPSQSSILVTSGVFQLTRNPMYLGMLLVLMGWGDLLDNILAYSGALIFFVYISAFQIEPEEKVMKLKFTEDFSEYCRQVRRWL
jgi:protein-S-isoprenylcysteine O-methyltransferase Ste14